MLEIIWIDKNKNKPSKLTRTQKQGPWTLGFRAKYKQKRRKYNRKTMFFSRFRALICSEPQSTRKKTNYLNQKKKKKNVSFVFTVSYLKFTKGKELLNLYGNINTRIHWIFILSDLIILLTAPFNENFPTDHRCQSLQEMCILRVQNKLSCQRYNLNQSRWKLS